MKDTIAILALLALLVGTCVGGGIYFGRRYERKQFFKFLPKAMDKLCVECNEIGVKEGIEKGYHDGLMTCDDLLKKEDARGRY